jgi:two-component system OmpR family response regulator
MMQQTNGRAHDADANGSADSSEQRRPRVLMVEDDRELVEAISEYLVKNGLDVVSVARGDLAAAAIEHDLPDVVVLDLMLPGRNGLDVCKDLRAGGCRIPIVMLTARDEDFDEVLGLEVGADDYIAKPVKPRLLLARINAQLRRQAMPAEAEADTGIMRFGRLSISPANRQVKLDEEYVSLSSAEFDLLFLLASNAGRVMPRERILQTLRGLTNSRSDRSIDARMYRLRSRFSHVPEVAHRLKTVRPHGYLFSTEDW